MRASSRRWLLSTIILSLSACDSPTTPERVQGLYELIQFDGTSLPAKGSPNGGCSLLVTHDSIALDSNGRYAAVINAGPVTCPDGNTHEAYWPDAGTYQIQGERIDFQPDDPAALAFSGRFASAGSVERYSLTIEHVRGTYDYMRMPSR